MDNFESYFQSLQVIRCDSEQEERSLQRLCKNRGIYFTKREYRSYPIFYLRIAEANRFVPSTQFSLFYRPGEYVPMKNVRLNLRICKNSTRDWVRDNLPESWLKAAKKFKCQEEMVKRICATVPHIYRNNTHVKESRLFIKRRIFNILGTNIVNLIDMTNADIQKWRTIGEFILNYEESCR